VVNYNIFDDKKLLENDIITHMEVVSNSIGVQKAGMPEVVGETRETLIRDNRGRFVVGNRESVGNKGGRPKDITLKEIMEDENKIYELIQNGDDRSFKALTKFFDGKLK
jgi:hypothetical protein